MKHFFENLRSSSTGNRNLAESAEVQGLNFHSFRAFSGNEYFFKLTDSLRYKESIKITLKSNFFSLSLDLNIRSN